MVFYNNFNPDVYEQGVYTWERIGTYGIEIGVEINPMRSVSVMIGVGWERYRRLPQTNLRIGICQNSCSIDLRGNRYDEEYPYFYGKGMATCAINTAIQFLLPFFKQPETAYIGDEISNVDDQSAPEEKQAELAEKRKTFWKRFGFHIDKTNNMSCKLSELKLIKYGKMLDEFDRFIPIEEFRKDENHSSLNELFSSEGDLHISEIIPKDLWAIRPVKYSPSFSIF